MTPTSEDRDTGYARYARYAGYDCRIVLVRPRDPNNIGAVARAMKNFGFSDLTVVAPHPPTWHEITSAVHAEDLLARARVVPTLAAAIEDRTLVVGTLDRTRVESKQSLFTPLDLSRDSRLLGQRLALVFGSEKHGLVRDDLSHCQLLMSIPTLPGCPSINLGQAVAICCYELTREPLRESLPVIAPEMATAGAVESALSLSIDLLRRIDFILPGNEINLTHRIRSTFMRLGMTRYDVEMLCGILSRLKRLG
jgi:TrmH family RNA methyltransferase